MRLWVAGPAARVRVRPQLSLGAGRAAATPLMNTERRRPLALQQFEPRSGDLKPLGQSRDSTMPAAAAGEGRPWGVICNSLFISAFAIANGLLLIFAPTVVGAIEANLEDPPAALDAAVKAVGEAALSPWARAFGVQACMVGAMYLLDLAFGPASRSFAKGSGIMRFVWAGLAAAVIVPSGGPWYVLATVLLGDCGSGAHLLWAVSQWRRPAGDAGKRPKSLLWRGPYWSGMLHCALTFAIGILLLVQPFVVASVYGALTARLGGRTAQALLTPATLVVDEVWGRLFAVFSMVTGLFFAQHGPNAFVASVGARLVVIAGALATAALVLSEAPRAMGGPPDAGDLPWLVAPAISIAIPSLVSVPLAVLEHLVLNGKPDPMAVREVQLAKDAHLE